MLLGAVIGNIIGSPYSSPKTEIKSKEFPLVSDTSHFTNDSVMTMAIADALMNWKKGEEINDVIFEREVVRSMRDFAGQYRHLSHSFSFVKWLMSPNPRPYGSKGNGSAMRVSPVAWYFDDLWSVEHFAEITARVTHNHPEGIKGAQAVAGAVFLARTGKTKQEIKDYITSRYGYDLSRSLDEIRPDYTFDATCPGSVPEAITAFLEAEDFEDAVRNAVSLGGDADTLACITAAIAQAMWGVPNRIEKMITPILDHFMMSRMDAFSAKLEGKEEAERFQPAKNGITEMVFILDKSGSMSHLTDDTIGGFNTMIEQQKAEPGEALVSTVLFSVGETVIHDRVKLSNVPPMTKNEYQAYGGTALLDAIGRAIKHIGNVHRHSAPEDVPERTLFVITTDGEENSSCQYSGPEIKRMIEHEREKYGWEFLFIGANIDAITAAESIGISRARSANYHADMRGTRAVFASVGRAMFDTRMSGSVSEDWSSEIDTDFDSRS